MLENYLTRVLSLAVAVLLSCPQSAPAAGPRIRFSGGPEGGTFLTFTKSISAYLSQNPQSLTTVPMASVGSVENIRRLNSRDAEFGIAYAGDLFLARQGRLAHDDHRYRNISAVALLYHAPVHLIVRADSGVNSVEELSGRRIAVGAAGSGSAAAARRYFEGLELWKRMRVEHVGFHKAADALQRGEIDAMWVMAGLPNAAVHRAANSSKVKFLNTWETGARDGVFGKNPFYTPATIPAGAYPGVEAPIRTFQDSALWVASNDVADELVYHCLREVFSARGLAFLRSATPLARGMGVARGLRGIFSPVHRGAQTFWREQGLRLTPQQAAR